MELKTQLLLLKAQMVINIYIKYLESDFLGDGSYLMFPWVNRIRDQNIDNFMVESIFKDGNGIPLHGLYAN